VSTTAAQVKSPVRLGKPDIRPVERRSVRSQLSRAGLGYGLAVLAIGVGFKVSEGYFLTAESGLGYALGIIGGSSMLALLLYPLRKRYRVMRFLGPVSVWFKAHMFLGVLGPILILYHASFQMGSTNSSVAMVCMLMVAGSGVIGRYLYSKIHNGLYGRRMSLEELRSEAASNQQDKGSGLGLLPGLMAELERLEKELMEPASGLLVVLNPFLAGLRARLMQWRFGRAANALITRLSQERPVVAQHAPNLKIAAMRYGERRLQAARRVAQFQLFEKAFSLWHVLHFPIFLMMVLTAIVHVVAVHMY
jgi:hypothetical protein